MTTPWFLEQLGLGESADERAIKRAYATRLKKIDQATDVAGFTDLHQAYQAALTWRATHTPKVDSATTEAESHSGQSPGTLAASVDSEKPPERPTRSTTNSNDSITNPEEAARVAHAQLVERIAHGDSADTALGEQLDVLRLGHLRAPFLFELRLIESLADGSISQRLELFNAAQRYFSWRDIGHLGALGQHGGWVNSVKMESRAWSEQWQQLPGVLLLDALKFGSPDGLPSANQWPKIHSIIQRFPHFLPLQLDQIRVNALKLAFDALPDSEKDWAHDTSPLPFLRSNTQTAKPAPRSRLPIGLAIMMVLLIIRFIGAIANSATTHSSYSAAPHPPATLLALNLQRFTPTRESCESLVPIVDRIAPFQDDERTHLRSAVRSCLKFDYWPTDHRNDDALRKLGI